MNRINENIISKLLLGSTSQCHCRLRLLWRCIWLLLLLWSCILLLIFSRPSSPVFYNLRLTCCLICCLIQNISYVVTSFSWYNYRLYRITLNRQRNSSRCTNIRWIQRRIDLTDALLVGFLFFVELFLLFLKDMTINLIIWNH